MIPLSKDELLGKFEPEKHPDFVRVHDGLTEGSEHWLRKIAAEAWHKMRMSALPDQVNLRIVSSTRNFERQKQIWENKWSGKTAVNGIFLHPEVQMSPESKALEILKFSAMPGTSRHHWGTDIDLNSVEPEYFETEEGKNIYRWLKVNAHRFGFYQPYTARCDSRPIGYEEEKWHWSYLPESRKILKSYLSLIDYSDITDFAGHELAEDLSAIPVYVNGINPDCK
ncbi:MAG: M15 family metallopeptidase [Bacteroidia bacterium]